MDKKIKLPKIPSLLDTKIYKTGQTRGADDKVIFQNRVGRNSTVLIPYDYFDICSTAPDNDGAFEKGFIVLIKPDDYFEVEGFQDEMQDKGLILGINALLFYETRKQWNSHNPEVHGFTVPNSRTSPLYGEYVARVPSTTSTNDEKITIGFDTSGLKGAGIRIYEYASLETIKKCRTQLEYYFWLCIDSKEVMLSEGMSEEDINTRKDSVKLQAENLGLADRELLIENRIINEDNNCICPFCLEPISANGFLNRLGQAYGRDVPDLTVTQINLFHIKELKTGEFNHKPYNLGWGHHHCNVVVKDAGIDETLKWMSNILKRNSETGFELV